MTLENCPGRYCGRYPLANGSLSECGVCPRGFRVLNSPLARNTLFSLCFECDDTIRLYDTFYLGFMFLLPFILHLQTIEEIRVRSGQRKPIATGYLFASVIVETVLSAVLVVLFTKPAGTFRVFACQTEQLSDWYTLFYNPTPDYTKTIHCTNEAVYPLQTMVYMFYITALIAMLILRPIFAALTSNQLQSSATYAAMYFIPVLSVIHTLFSGLIYYSFPYVSLLVSIWTLVKRLAHLPNQTSRTLVRDICFVRKNLVEFAILWFMHGYGFVSLCLLWQWPIYWLAVPFLVPVPTLFYIGTTSLTDPRKLYNDYY